MLLTQKGTSMKVRVYVDKVKALRAGQDVFGYQVAELQPSNLTGSQRDELARYAANPLPGDLTLPGAHFFLDKDYTAIGFTEIDVKLELDRLRRSKSEAREALVQQWLTCPLEEFLCWSGVKDRGDDSNYKVPTDPRLDSRYAEARQAAEQRRCEREAREAEKRERSRQAYAARQAEEQAKEDALKAWALEHGTPLLQARVQDGFEWKGLARQEFADAFVRAHLNGIPEAESPDWDFKFRDGDRTAPDLEEIAFLRGVRKRLQGTGAAGSLRWVRYEAKEETGYDDYKGSRPARLTRSELLVEIPVPDGSEQTRWFQVPAIAPAENDD
jgi:hypothetical protein